MSYIRVKDRWNYLCVIINLYNREIVGYSISEHHDSELVKQAFIMVRSCLPKVQIFHSDRGSEYNNYELDEILKINGIERSLSRKGNPYDNAVAESTFKMIKTEFVRSRWFSSIEHLRLEWTAYVYWFNNKRIHSSLGYLSPVQYKNTLL